MSFIDSLKLSIIGQSLATLPKSSRIKLYIVGVLQALIAILDLAGVGIIGLLGALTITGVQSRQPGNRVYSVLSYLNIQDLTLQKQAIVLGLLAVLLFVLRTLLTIFFARKTLYFLSTQGAKLGSKLLSNILSRKLLFLQTRTSQEYLFMITMGANSLTIGILGTFINLIADLSLLVVMTIGLLYINPIIAIQTILLFVVVAFGVYRILHKKAGTLSEVQYKYSVRGNEKILEVLTSFRETFVRNRTDFYSKENERIRMKLAYVYAETTFMPNISKYAIETTIVIGAFAICAFQFATQDAVHAIATLSIFLAAGARIAPAVLRVQQGAVLVRSSIGYASPVLELIEELRGSKDLPLSSEYIDFEHVGFLPKVNLEGVSLKYPGASDFAIKNINLEFESGKVVALVGPSGAGKTSIVDVILGVIDPTTGNVKISGKDPFEAITSWPGALAYVPQDVIISRGTIRENIAIGFPPNNADDDAVWKSLEIAELADFVRSFPTGLDTEVGERGAKISGGQRQRLGIARALFTNPKLLILDEATSALDGETEANIAKSIQRLKGQVTVLMIAHRLSTIRDADLVIYMDKGSVIATGTFDEVRERVKDFDRQANLMGL